MIEIYHTGLSNLFPLAGPFQSAPWCTNWVKSGFRDIQAWIHRIWGSEYTGPIYPWVTKPWVLYWIPKQSKCAVTSAPTKNSIDRPSPRRFGPATADHPSTWQTPAPFWLRRSKWTSRRDSTRDLWRDLWIHTCRQPWECLSPWPALRNSWQLPPGQFEDSSTLLASYSKENSPRNSFFFLFQ